MKRFLAVVVAVAMVGLSFVVRDRLDRDDEDTDVATGGSTEERDEDEPLRLVCATELREVCGELDGVEVTVEEAGATVDRLATSPGDGGLDAWLAPAPWPGIADIARQQAQLEPRFGEAPPPLARTRLAAFGPSDRVEGCGWRCLGDAATAAEAPLRLGVPETDGAIGLLVFAALTVGWFDRADVATNDLRGDAAYADWITSLSAEARPEGRPTLRRVQASAFFDVALTTAQEAQPVIAEAVPARIEGLALQYPAPVATVDLVLAGDAGDLADELVPRLDGAGWETADLTGGNGLPSAGVLTELRALLGAG